MYNYKDLISRNWLFITKKEQKKLKKLKILIAGVGMGSVIAESLVRLGCENLIIADGDDVEFSNLNRQNYYISDLNKNKAQQLKKRLLKINPNTKIKCLPFFFTKENISKYIKKSDIIINTIDFDSEAFIYCSELCKKFNKLEVFPINLGFGASVSILNKKSPNFSSFFKEKDPFKLKVKIIDYIIKESEHFQFSKDFNRYKAKNKIKYDPQMYISSLTASILISSIIMKKIRKKKFKKFPQSYYVDTFEIN